MNIQNVESRLGKYEAALMQCAPYAAIPIAVAYELGRAFHHGIPLVMMTMDFSRAAIAMSLCALLIGWMFMTLTAVIKFAGFVGQKLLWGIPRYIVVVSYIYLTISYVALLVSGFSEKKAFAIIENGYIFVLGLSIFCAAMNMKHGDGFWDGFLLKFSVTKDDDAKKDSEFSNLTAALMISCMFSFSVGANVAKWTAKYNVDGKWQVIGTYHDFLIVKNGDALDVVDPLSTHMEKDKKK